MRCRFCGSTLDLEFIDLGASPPSNSFLTGDQLDEPEVYYPLRLYVCRDCFLVQIDECKKSTEIFSEDYVYFSSYSSTWLEHAGNYVEMIVPRLGLGKDSLVFEIGSNDGCLLRNVRRKGIPCLGIEPAAGVAAAAREHGLDVVQDFFSLKLAEELARKDMKADLIIGNNVLAHIPDLNDFVAGLKTVLKENGVITMEFPHLLRLVQGNQFDTIYHEHYSYFSLLTVRRVFAGHGLAVFDVEELSTHGGSIRIYAGHDKVQTPGSRVRDFLEKEREAGMDRISFYRGFQDKADMVKSDLLQFLIEQKRAGKTVAAYGAAAKGNTLLNYCGVKKDLVRFVADASPHKQGKYLPGSRIPVHREDRIQKIRPDFVLVLPWNIKDEIMEQLGYISGWGGEFVTAIPELKIFKPGAPRGPIV
ncbi:MAG: class I SAM-dependent methyltransferase [Thermodesulfobacteriota bacterium]|nr:class I SAM-dependent methyltransferase [Thermodesulfobacteriota bacterium]